MTEMEFIKARAQNYFQFFLYQILGYLNHNITSITFNVIRFINYIMEKNISERIATETIENTEG